MEEQPKEQQSKERESEERGQNVVNFYFSLFKGVVAVAIFGASISFSVIFQQLSPDRRAEDGNQPFDYNTAQAFLGTAWLLFVIALGVSGLSLGLLTFYQKRIKDSITRGVMHKFEKYALGASLLVQGLTLGSLSVLESCRDGIY